MGSGCSGGSSDSAACTQKPYHKVELVTSELGSITIAIAYHTSVMVDNQEYAFSDGGISRARGPASHQALGTPFETIEIGFSAKTGKQLHAVLKAHFQRGTYDLVRKNCNSFSDAALYFLLQKRLNTKYRTLDRLGASHPSLVQSVSKGAYSPNPKADSFNLEALVHSLDPNAAAVCITPDCGKPTWNGQPSEKCNKSCGMDLGAGSGAVCTTPGCGKPTWNGKPGEGCSKACKTAAGPAICFTLGCGKPTWNGQPGQKCSKSCF